MNEWNIEILEKFSNLFYFAAYHPDDDNALKYAEQMINHPRVAGIKPHLQMQKLYPSDKRLFPLYEKVFYMNGMKLLTEIRNLSELFIRTYFNF